uniref:ALF transcription elongation factor 2 n=1 Tax=Salmo trutta TaxID=8032 RepID=A0A674ATR8_SALTR
MPFLFDSPLPWQCSVFSICVTIHFLSLWGCLSFISLVSACQDRNALKKREWERRTQEVQQDEDLFSSGFNLFGEPYKTNKGDALANRVQNTLGNYDEMKELLTSHSNQSHLVGIPKNFVPQTPGPMEKLDQPMDHRGDSSSSPSSSSTSTLSRRHGGGQQQAAKAPSAAEHGSYKDSNTHVKSPLEQEPGSHGASSPVASTSLLPSGLSTPTFPQGLHVKPSAVQQQKPTAYVRPMDGQDQMPLDSPELKPPLEVVDVGYSNPAFGSTITSSKSKLPKLTLTQTGEVGSCMIPITLQYTHTGLEINIKCCGKAICSVLDRLAVGRGNSIPVATSRTSDPGHSSGASASSSESESSSESDSDSESSSSDSECNRASRTATPEPEPPSTNKWQLDKWLNKVTPHNKALISTQPERESHGLCSSQPDHSQQAPGSQDLAPGKSKPGPTVLLAQTDAKERALLSPIREKAKPKTGPKVSEGKSSKSPAAVVEPAPARRSIGKKQPKKVECSSSLEEHSSWSKPINPSISTTPKEKEPPPLLEPPKSRTKGTSGKAAPRKEPRTTTTTTSTPKKHRGPSKILPKSKEFIETESSSSECHSEPEDLIKVPNPPCPGPSSLQTLKAAKDCNSNILSVSSLTSTCSTSISIPDPGVVGGLMEDPLLSPVPIVQNELLSPLRDFEDIKSLWVKIELSFLSRIPGQDPPEPPPVKVERQSPASQQSTPVEKPPSKAKRKHKASAEPFSLFFSLVHTADYYMQEAKKLKHKADALMEKYGKAVNYADGALSFIECGNAMERDPLEAKSPYTMYSETVELIRYAMRLKNFTSHSATVAEKKLAVLCNRCLSLLYLRMFKLKKDHAVKYSRSLMEYFKNSAKSSQVPSPWGANGKNTGTPSPLSLSLSPVSWGSSSTGPAGSGASGNVAIPQRIHQMAASHINITNNILRSYEHWDTAEKLATESQEFFQELDSMMEPLSQHSSMIELVRYIRQGLHWLRIEAHLL